MDSKKTIIDIFVDGARKGLNLSLSGIVPNVVMAFILIHILRVTGFLDIMSAFLGPVMQLFGLPGEAFAVLMSAFMSMGGGIGVAAGLYKAGILNENHLTIIAPAIMLMGAQVQYMGRLLGTAAVPVKYYPVLFGISIMNAAISLVIMRILA